MGVSFYICRFVFSPGSGTRKLCLGFIITSTLSMTRSTSFQMYALWDPSNRHSSLVE